MDADETMCYLLQAGANTDLGITLTDDMRFREKTRRFPQKGQKI